MPDINSSDTRNILQTFTNTAATIAANQVAQDAALAANQAAQNAAFAAQTADNATQAAATLAAQTAALAAQAAADAANAGVTAVTATATEISSSMIINEVFTIPSSEFVLQGSGLYHAIKTLIKVDGTKGVQLTLTDSDGDAQGFSQLISPYLGDVQKATVELNANQFTNNDYPLSFICQGCKLPAATPPSGGASFTRLGNLNHWYRLVGDTLQYSSDGVTSDPLMDSYNVLEAFMLTNNGEVYIKRNDDTYYKFAGALPAEPGTDITQVTYDSRVGFLDRIVIN